MERLRMGLDHIGGLVLLLILNWGCPSEPPVSKVRWVPNRNRVT